jgi:hypothetical protein
MKNKFNLNEVLKNISNGDCSMLNSFSKKELELICIVKGIEINYLRGEMINRIIGVSKKKQLS